MHTNMRFDIFQCSVILLLSRLSNLDMNNKLAFRFIYFVIYSFIAVLFIASSLLQA